MPPAAGSERARLFFALWPDESVRRTLGALALDAQAQCGGRATPLDKIHLTLFFVGDVERSRIDALETAAASLGTTSFELVLDRLGYWRHNRIAWAGASKCPRALAALASGLHDALGQAGVKGEDRPYVPHMTLVRNAARPPAAAAFPPCTWRAREFVLIESVSVAGGVRYDVRSHWPL